MGATALRPPAPSPRSTPTARSGPSAGIGASTSSSRPALAMYACGLEGFGVKRFGTFRYEAVGVQFLR